MKGIKIILLFCILCPLLSGCYDSVEPERMAYLHGLGIDYKDGKYQVYLQFINTGAIAKSESGSSASKEKVEIGHAAGENINEAMFHLYNSAQIRVFWGHLKFIVLSKAALENKGMDKVLDLMDRYRETRYRIWMYATEEDVKEILRSYQPLQVTSALNKLAEPMNNYKQNSFIQPIKMREFLIAIHQPGQSGFVPQVSLTKGDTWEEDHKTLNAVQINGMAFLTKEKLLGFLTDNDVAGHQWVTEKSKRSGVTVKKDDTVIAKLVIEKNKVDIKPEIIGDTVHFNISVKPRGIINEIDQQMDEGEIGALASNKIKEDILHTYTKALSMNADVYELSEVLHRKNNKAWKRLNKDGKIPLNEDSITVNVSLYIKDSGKLRPIK